MLREFKSDQLFVEKIKLSTNFHMENLSHSSWNKSPRKYKQQAISEKQMKTIVSNFDYPFMLGGFWNDQ